MIKGCWGRWGLVSWVIKLLMRVNGTSWTKSNCRCKVMISLTSCVCLRSLLLMMMWLRQYKEHAVFRHVVCELLCRAQTWQINRTFLVYQVCAKIVISCHFQILAVHTTSFPFSWLRMEWTVVANSNVQNNYLILYSVIILNLFQRLSHQLKFVILPSF